MNIRHLGLLVLSVLLCGLGMGLAYAMDEDQGGFQDMSVYYHLPLLPVDETSVLPTQSGAEVNLFTKLAEQPWWAMTYNGATVQYGAQGRILDLNTDGGRLMLDAVKAAPVQGYKGVMIDPTLDATLLGLTGSDVQIFLNTLTPRVKQFLLNLENVARDVPVLLVLSENSFLWEQLSELSYTGLVTMLPSTVVDLPVWQQRMALLWKLSNEGKELFLQLPVVQDRWWGLVSYELLRGPHTAMVMDTAQFDPLLMIQLGAPAVQTTSLSALRDSSTELYVRRFKNGVAVLNPELQERLFSFDGVMQRADIQGSETGETLLWLNVADNIVVAPHTGVILRYVEAPTAPAVKLAPKIEVVKPPVTPITQPLRAVTPPVIDAAVDVFNSLISGQLEELFSDVASTLRNAMAIEYLYTHKVVQGYQDGTFKPYQTVNRAELLKMLLEGDHVEVSTPKIACFLDVPTDVWYAPYVCTAKAKGWVEGYPNGLFQPERTVSKVEALKILGEVYDWDLDTMDQSEMGFSDVESAAWYAPYLRFAKGRNLLEEEGTIYAPTFGMNRGKIAEYLFRWLVVKEQKLDGYTVDAGLKALKK